MKIHHVLIIGLVFLFVPTQNLVSASCVPENDTDWPTKPICLGEGPVRPSLQKMREAWDGYYQYKGKEWMEAKKIEMDGAVRNNSLQQWIDTNITNHNVWYYYWIYGQVPNPQGIPIDQVFSTQDTELSFPTYVIGIPIVIGGAIVALLIIKKRVRSGKRTMQ